MKKPILLFIGLCLAATITAQEKPAGNGWWNNNPSLVMPIREVGVTGIRPMKEIGVQKTQLDTLVLHENIALSMADVLTFNTAIFIKQYGRATLSTVAFRGTAASHTQVMWNGMRINSPMLGMTDFSMIPSYFVDDATLLHGTSSLNVVGGGLGGGDHTGDQTRRYTRIQNAVYTGNRLVLDDGRISAADLRRRPLADLDARGLLLVAQRIQVPQPRQERKCLRRR
ncbi:MAG: TonB-dependent receptor [Alistipes onderdonkii]